MKSFKKICFCFILAFGIIFSGCNIFSDKIGITKDDWLEILGYNGKCVVEINDSVNGNSIIYRDGNTIKIQKDEKITYVYFDGEKYWDYAQNQNKWGRDEISKKNYKDKSYRIEEDLSFEKFKYQEVTENYQAKNLLGFDYINIDIVNGKLDKIVMIKNTNIITVKFSYIDVSVTLPEIEEVPITKTEWNNAFNYKAKHKIIFNQSPHGDSFIYKDGNKIKLEKVDGETLYFNIENNKYVMYSYTEETATFIFPLENYTIIKNYLDAELQYNPDLQQWEIHKGIDFTSDLSTSVRAVYDGEVSNIYKSNLDGCVVEISHKDGLKTIYMSLSENLPSNVYAGAVVKQGDIIGTISNLKQDSNCSEGYVHFEVELNGVKVDPNKYLVSNNNMLNVGWKKSEIQEEYYIEAIANFGSFLEYEYFTYNHQTELFEGQYMGAGVSVKFEDEKVKQVKLNLNNATYTYVYDENFTIELPIVDEDLPEKPLTEDEWNDALTFDDVEKYQITVTTAQDVVSMYKDANIYKKHSQNGAFYDEYLEKDGENYYSYTVGTDNHYTKHTLYKYQFDAENMEDLATKYVYANYIYDTTDGLYKNGATSLEFNGDTLVKIIETNGSTITTYVFDYESQFTITLPQTGSGEQTPNGESVTESEWQSAFEATNYSFELIEYDTFYGEVYVTPDIIKLESVNRGDIYVYYDDEYCYECDSMGNKHLLTDYTFNYYNYLLQFSSMFNFSDFTYDENSKSYVGYNINYFEQVKITFNNLHVYSVIILVNGGEFKYVFNYDDFTITLPQINQQSSIIVNSDCDNLNIIGFVGKQLDKNNIIPSPSLISNADFKAESDLSVWCLNSSDLTFDLSGVNASDSVEPIYISFVVWSNTDNLNINAYFKKQTENGSWEKVNLDFIGDNIKVELDELQVSSNSEENFAIITIKISLLELSEMVQNQIINYALYVEDTNLEQN